MMKAFTIPSDMAPRLVSARWDLGDIYVADGVARLIDIDDIDIDALLRRHLAGDYGLVNRELADLERTRAARNAGRPFTSLFHLRGDVLKVITHPRLSLTIVCLSWEA